MERSKAQPVGFALVAFRRPGKRSLNAQFLEKALFMHGSGFPWSSFFLPLGFRFLPLESRFLPLKSIFLPQLPQPRRMRT